MKNYSEHGMCRLLKHHIVFFEILFLLPPAVVTLATNVEVV